MQTIDYRGYKIKSTPSEILDEDPYRYSPNGVIQVGIGNTEGNILVQNLEIPDSDWKQFTEHDADAIFIKYAKQYVDEYINK